MNEKRFTGGSYGVYDNYKGDRLLWSEWEEVTGIMNNLDLKARERGKALSKLHKENEQLKKSYDISEDYNDSLVKENEELHQIQMDLVTERDSLRKENTNLFDENEQLKHRLAISEKANYVTALENENEQLKKELGQFYLLIGRGDWSGLVDLIKGDLE